jgi:alpha-glucuronidase
LLARLYFDEHNLEDRARQAYDELVPLDGMFRENVFLQVKNGPIDFQPREPHHPLFGAMTRTRLMLEVQITQEYLGRATHLVYLAPLFKETLDADTSCHGAGSPGSPILERNATGVDIPSPRLTGLLLDG